MSNDSPARITFLGGASGIGASCALVETDAANVVIDCGIRFEPGRELPDLSPLSGKRIDAILLTHAHTDHTGALPVVVEAFPSTPVYATPPTIDLIGILLHDALKLMRSAERESEVPLYAEAQVERAIEALHPVGFGASVNIFGVDVTWLAASHILGAAMIHLATPAGNVLFTGDYSVTPQHTVPALARPSLPVDIVVSEATYGERLHEDRVAAAQRLIEQVGEVLEAGGRVLIPAFAIGRAQEVLCILKKAMARGSLAPTAVWVDGMVRAVCEVYPRHEQYLTRQLATESRQGRHPFYSDEIQPVRDPSERARILAGGPCVIVASSGMLSGGASACYAREIARQKRDAILLTGYQDEESPGRALLAMASGQGPRTLRLGNETVEVACSVASYGLSAHADRMQLAGLIESMRPRTVVLVHGDRQAKQALGRSLTCRDVVLAEDGQSILRRGRPFTRRTAAAQSAPLPDRDDLERVRALLGPPAQEPSLDRHIAEAWFGTSVAAEQRDQLVARLEELGVVRRDDKRRDRIWVLSPSETRAYPEEALLQDRLKAENPKGRLLELCMRMQLSPPALDISVDGAHHVAEMSMELGGKVLRSGPQRAAVRKTAEQLAAAQLLRAAESESSLEHARAADDQAAALLRANPKGRLLEWCAANLGRVAQFEQRPGSGGYAARVVVRGDTGATFTSAWYAALQLKTAEQAAAAEALTNLARLSSSSTDGDPKARPTSDAPAPCVPLPTREARALLNELRQVGIISDFGYRLEDRRGPSHQPVFAVIAWASLPDKSTIESDLAEAPSKKAAERDAAQRLVDRLADVGLVGRTRA
ncbi:MAG: MBL fold metallo-hydrolase [Deltaproteobacteria bacterium]|nr:MBL fold metallo-hydrolase [Deltaproteobacteria bacterium]